MEENCFGKREVTATISYEVRNGRLLISGKGEIPDYEKFEYCYSHCAPWMPDHKMIKHIIISQEITRIGTYAFSGLEYVKHVKLSESVETISAGAFEDDIQLEEIEFPAALKHVGAEAFLCCGNLKKIILNGSCPEFGWNALNGINSLRICQAYDFEHKNTTYCKIHIGKNFTAEIGEYGFSHCTKVVEEGEIDDFYPSDLTPFYQAAGSLDILKASDSYLIGKTKNGRILFSGEETDLLRNDKGAVEMKQRRDKDQVLRGFVEADSTFATIIWFMDIWRNVEKIIADKYFVAAITDKGEVYCTAAKHPGSILPGLSDIVDVIGIKNNILRCRKKNLKIVKYDLLLEEVWKLWDIQKKK